jgi:hypothetical protein
MTRKTIKPITIGYENDVSPPMQEKARLARMPGSTTNAPKIDAQVMPTILPALAGFLDIYESPLVRSLLLTILLKTSL